VDAEAAAERREWTENRAWTAERVEEAMAAAFQAYRLGRKTVEHAEILTWPALYVTLFDYDAKRAAQIRAYAATREWTETALVTERLCWTWPKYYRALGRAYADIAAALNAGKGAVAA
jgi:hypothetical protein